MWLALVQPICMFYDRFHKVVQSIPHTLLIISISVFICPLLLFSAEYYVSNSGNDFNDGLGSSQAWKTIDKVNKTKFLPGDIICFEKNGVWREYLSPQSGNETGYITYTSYSTGNKPLFTGSVNKNKENDWTNVSENIWSTSNFSYDVADVIFIVNGETNGGIKVWKEDILKNQNQFFYDQTNKIIKLYSVQNPATLYNDIECALTKHIIDQGGRSYIIYKGLHLAYGGAHGFGGGSTHHIIIKDCDLCFIGGGFQNKTTRFGNAIEFWGDAHDNIVEGCKIWEAFDAGVTNQGGGTNSQYNIYYRNNIIWNCAYTFEYWNRPASSTTHDIYFENNICYNAGRPGARPRYGLHLAFFENPAKTYNFYVWNNIFINAISTCIGIDPSSWAGVNNFVLDNNLYCQSSDKIVISWNKAYYDKDFDAYKSATGKDENSILVSLNKISFGLSSIKMHNNETYQLKTTGLFSQNKNVNITYFATYNSSNKNIATVDSKGLIKSVNKGEANITATFEDKIAAVLVKVIELY